MHGVTMKIKIIKIHLHVHGEESSTAHTLTRAMKSSAMLMWEKTLYIVEVPLSNCHKWNISAWSITILVIMLRRHIAFNLLTRKLQTVWHTLQRTDTHTWCWSVSLQESENFIIIIFNNKEAEGVWEHGVEENILT